MNNVIVWGRIVSFDYREDRETQAKNIVYMHLAVKRNHSTDDQKYYYLPCKADGDRAQYITDHFNKGDCIFIQGEYQTYDIDQFTNAGHVVHINAVNSILNEVLPSSTTNQAACEIENQFYLAESPANTIQQISAEIANNLCEQLISNTIMINSELASIWAKIYMENSTNKLDAIINALQFVRNYKENLEDIEKRAIALENIYSHEISMVNESIFKTNQVLSTMEAYIKDLLSPSMLGEREGKINEKNSKDYVELKLKNEALLFGRIVHNEANFIVFVAVGDKEEPSENFSYNPFHVIPTRWILSIKESLV
jgi:single-stranded DNA-binding protein